MDSASTSDILDRHLKSFAEHNVDSVVADYSSDAAIRSFFETLIVEFAKPGSSFVMQLRCVDGAHAYILWAAETEDNSYEFATDTFVVQNGKIIAQSFAAEIKPKH